MTNYFYNSNFRKKERKKDVVSADVVEEVREKFKLTKGEMSNLMGFSNQATYTLCLNKRAFSSFRFYAAIDAIELSVMNEAHRIVKELTEIKSGIKIE